MEKSYSSLTDPQGKVSMSEMGSGLTDLLAGLGHSPLHWDTYGYEELELFSSPTREYHMPTGEFSVEALFPETN